MFVFSVSETMQLDYSVEDNIKFGAGGGGEIKESSQDECEREVT